MIKNLKQFLFTSILKHKKRQPDDSLKNPIFSSSLQQQPERHSSTS
jgi:hypothetical protein